MTALVFPPHPSIDDRFPDPSVPGIPTWIWDGHKWVLLGGAPPTQTALVYVSETPPLDVPEGSLWFDPSTGAFSILHATLWQEIASRAKTITATVLQGYIDGLNFFWLGAQDTFRVTNGVCNSDDHSGMISLVNDVDVNAAALFGAGGNLDAGTLAAGWYHVFAIDKDTFDAPDVLISKSAAAPTMPPDYTKKRRIFSYRAGASPFHPENMLQDGDLFLWDAQRLEGAVTNTAADVADRTPWTLAFVPDGINVEALITAQWFYSASSNNTRIYFTSPLIPGTWNATATRSFEMQAISGGSSIAEFQLLTNIYRQFRYQISANFSQVLQVMTRGWIDHRGKDEIIRPVVGSRQRIFGFWWSGTPTANIIGRTWRVVIPASQLVQAPGDRIQIEFYYPPGWATGVLQGAWVGHRGGTQPYHFDGNQVRLQFGGANSLSIAAGTLQSDEALFTYDPTRDLVVSSCVTGFMMGSHAGSPNVIGSYQGALGVDVSGTTEPSLTYYTHVSINVQAGFVRQP